MKTMEHDRAYYNELFEKALSEFDESTTSRGARKVIELETCKIYPSASAAARSIGCNTDSMTDAIRNKTMLKERNWDYLDNINNDPYGEIEKRVMFKSFNTKYSDCRTFVDVTNAMRFDSLQSAAQHFGLSTVAFGRYIRAFRPIDTVHYIVKTTMYEDYGQDKLIEMFEKWNKSNVESTTAFKKTKRVVNLNTGEVFESVADALLKYPDDNIRHYARSHNPSVTGNYWMFEDAMTKSASEHLAEFEQHFKEIGSKKRRVDNNHSNVPVLDLTNNKTYDSVADFAAAVGLVHSWVLTKFKKQVYCINGVVAVPKNVLEHVTDYEAFKNEQYEKFRTSNANKTVVNVTTRKKYSTVSTAAKDAEVSYNGLATALRNKTITKFKDNEWIRERYLEKDKFDNMQLEFVA